MGPSASVDRTVATATDGAARRAVSSANDIASRLPFTCVAA